MTYPYQFDRYSYVQPGSIPEFLTYAHHTMVTEPLREKAKTVEQKFRDLDVQPGDRIRLTEQIGQAYPTRVQTPKDAAVLEGIVEAVKIKGGESKVKIRGFAVAGNGIYWPVKNYKVEVLHRAYRWTDEDRALVEVANFTENYWKHLTEEKRETYRKQYRPRLERIRKALGIESAGVE